MNIVVYTTVFGETDRLKTPRVVNHEIRYICFTDRVGADLERMKEVGIWEVIPCAKLLQPRDAIRLSRKYKIRFDEVDEVKGADVSLWVDASFTLYCDPMVVADRYLWQADVVAMQHPHHSNIRQEAAAIIKTGRGHPELISAQLASYEETGFVDRQKRVTSTGFFMRRHATRVVDFVKRWWTEIEGWKVYRDQMSIDYVLQQTNLDLMYLEGHYMNNPYARWFPQ